MVHYFGGEDPAVESDNNMEPMEETSEESESVEKEQSHQEKRSDEKDSPSDNQIEPMEAVEEYKNLEKEQSQLEKGSDGKYSVDKTMQPMEEAAEESKNVKKEQSHLEKGSEGKVSAIDKTIETMEEAEVESKNMVKEQSHQEKGNEGKYTTFRKMETMKESEKLEKQQSYREQNCDKNKEIAFDFGNKMKSIEKTVIQTGTLQEEQHFQEQSFAEKGTPESAFSDFFKVKSAVSFFSQKRENEDLSEREKKRYKSSDSNKTGSGHFKDHSLETPCSIEFGTNVVQKNILCDEISSHDTKNTRWRNSVVDDSNISNENKKQLKVSEFERPDDKGTSETGTISSNIEFRQTLDMTNTSLPNVKFDLQTENNNNNDVPNIPCSTDAYVNKYDTPDIISDTKHAQNFNNKENYSYSSKSEIDFDFYSKIWDLTISSFDVDDKSTELKRGKLIGTMPDFIPKEHKIPEDKISTDSHDNVSEKVNISPDESKFYEDIPTKNKHNEHETNILLKNVVQKLNDFTREDVQMNVSNTGENKDDRSQSRELMKKEATSSEESMSCNQLYSYSNVLKDFSRTLKIDVDQPHTDLHAYEKLDSPSGCSDKNMNIRKVVDTPESSPSKENYSVNETRSSSLLKEAEKTFGLYEVGESSKEVLSFDKNYTPYPGLAAEPDKAKKDARYQKKFYKQKKTSGNQEQIESPKRSMSHRPYISGNNNETEELNNNQISSQENRSSFDYNLNSRNQFYDNQNVVKDNVSFSPYSFIIPEYMAEESDIPPPNVSMPKEFFIKEADFPPLNLTTSQNLASQMAELPSIDLGLLHDFGAESARVPCISPSQTSYMENSPNASPIRQPEDEKDCEQSEVGLDEFEYASQTAFELPCKSFKEKICKKVEHNEIAFYWQINFDSTYAERGKQMIYMKDRFYDIQPSDTMIPLKPMFGVEEIRQAFSDGDFSVEEFLVNLNNFETLYYEMKFFEDDSMASFGTLIRVVEIPMKLPREFDCDLELVGEELKKVRKLSKIKQRRLKLRYLEDKMKEI